MADRDDQHPYYELDPGEPRLHPDDYPKAGLGSFEQANAAAPVERPPSNDPAADEQLASRIRQELEANGQHDLSHVRVDVLNGTATLEGFTETRYARERAELLAKIDGVEEVANRIAIQQLDTAPGGPVLTTRDPDTGNEPTTQRS